MSGKTNSKEKPKAVIVNKNSKSYFPSSIIEAKMDIKPNQLDILHILMAEIGKSTDCDENLTYSISAELFATLKNYKSKDKAYQVLKEQTWGDPDNDDYGMQYLSFELYQNNGEKGRRYNWFSWVEYMDGQGYVVLKLNVDVKQMLVNVKAEKGQKVFAALKYILTMKSQFSKKIYLLCKEFEKSGIRYVEQYDFDLFRMRLSIPDSYNLDKIKKRILDKAKEEINGNTDIFIDYEIMTVPGRGRGGRKPVGIIFIIEKVEQGIAALEQKEPDKPTDTQPDSNTLLKNKILEIIPELTDKSLDVIIMNAECSGITEQELLEIVQYSANQNTDNVVRYINSIIINGFEKPISTKKKSNTFTNFPQRNYSQAELKDLEKALLKK